MGEYVIDVDDLAVQIHGQQALRRVSFRVPEAGSVGLVGETGSGKSLTCRVLVGLLDPIGAATTRGTVRFRETELSTASEKQWRKLRGREIATVPQASIGGLDPVRRVGSQLREAVRALDPDADADARSVELLDAMRLPDPESIMRRYPHELSGGMRQRVMIALSLVGRPALLLADEATTALDVTVQRSILELLTRLRREHQMAMLFVTHDLSVVEEVCDHVVIMYAGYTVEDGPTESVVRRPLHPYTQGLLAAQPGRAQRGEPLRSVAGSPPGLGQQIVGCPFADRCPYVEQRCRTTDVQLQSIASDHRVACIRASEWAS